MSNNIKVSITALVPNGKGEDKPAVGMFEMTGDWVPCEIGDSPLDTHPHLVIGLQIQGPNGSYDMGSGLDIRIKRERLE